MKKTGIFYGSTTGTTESVARLIAEKLGVSPADVHDVSKLDAAWQRVTKPDSGYLYLG